MRLPFLPNSTLGRVRALAWSGYHNQTMTVTQIAIESGRSVDDVAKVLDLANLASLKMPGYQTADDATISAIAAAMERLAHRRRGEV